MNQTARFAIIAIVLMVGCQSQRAQKPSEPSASLAVDDFSWLAGHWVQSSADGTTINEEMWLAPAGGMMLGVNRTIEDGQAVFFEFLMIREVNGRIAYLAMPGGQSPPTVFPLVETSAVVTAIFENPEHDFPRRIVYQREGDQLTATLTGPGSAQGEPRVETWRWRHAGESSR
jgi:hypothetical protein